MPGGGVRRGGVVGRGGGRVGPGGAIAEAEALHARGAYDAAIASCDALLSSWPGFAPAHHLAGRCLEASGRLLRAADRYGQAVSLDPRVAYVRDHAAALTEAGELDAACPVWRSASERAARGRVDPPTRVRIEWAACESELYTGAFEAAAARAARVLGDGRLSPGIDPPARLALTMHRAEALVRAKGEPEAAVAAMDEAIAIASGTDQATHAGALATEVVYGGWLGRRVSMIERLREVGPAAAERSVALGRASAPLEFVCKVLGRAEEELGNLHAAWSAYELGNRVAEAGGASGWSSEAHALALEAVLGAVGEGGLARADRGALASSFGGIRPVLIVGVPRSGTSLAEQVIASHPRAHGRGELQALRNAELWLGEMTGHRAMSASLVRGVDEGLATEAGRRYLARHAAALDANGLEGSDEDPVVVTDKMPGNFQHLHAAWQALRGVRVVWCVREAADAVFSCWSTPFAADLAYTRELGRMRAFHATHDRVLRFWQEHGGLAVHVLRYESMVSDPEGESRRLLEFCGLAWDARVLSFWSRGRRVLTASSEQASRAIYTTSIGRAARFGARATG